MVRKFNQIYSVIQNSFNQNLFFAIAIVIYGLLTSFLILKLQDKYIGLMLLFIFVFIPVVIFGLNSKTKTRFYGIIFFLPFLQALSFKFGPRWALSDILAWSLVLPVLVGAQTLIFSRENKNIFTILILIFLYSTFISIISLVFILHEFPWNSAAEHFYITPVFRTIMENARLLASVVTVGAFLLYVQDERSFLKIIRMLGVSGIAASSYGLYQGIQMLWFPSFLLLPGTLSQPGLRLWGTFYEPNGYGGFCVATGIILGFLSTYDTSFRWIWRLGLVATISGAILSVATTAWIAATAASISIIIATFHIRYKMRYRFKSIFTVLAIAGILVGLLYSANQIINLEDIFWRNRSLANIEHRYEDVVILNYEGMLRWFLVMPLGIGQGLLVFLHGGAPGIFRWIAEMGVTGIVLILALHWKICKSILLLFRGSDLVGAFAPFAIALYVAMIIISSRYAHTTHIWIWFFTCLPLVANNIRGQNKNGSLDVDERHPIMHRRDFRSPFETKRASG